VPPGGTTFARDYVSSSSTYLSPVAWATCAMNPGLQSSSAAKSQSGWAVLASAATNKPEPRPLRACRAGQQEMLALNPGTDIDVGRYLWLVGMRAGGIVAGELWDDDARHILATCQADVARNAGALVQLQYALSFVAWTSSPRRKHRLPGWSMRACLTRKSVPGSSSASAPSNGICARCSPSSASARAGNSAGPCPSPYGAPCRFRANFAPKDGGRE
jgi:hypothetical protein